MNSIKILLVLILVFCDLNGQNIVYLNPGCRLFDADGQCVSCSMRFYQDQNGICQPVNPNCNTYEDTGACTSCYSGFAIVEDTCLPQAIVSPRFDPFCNRFQGSVCVKCSFGYYFNQNRKCTQADPNCKQFNENNGHCITCYPGFEILGTGCITANPQSRDPNCNQFENGQCIKCSFGFYFNEENICTIIPGDCADFDVENKLCKACYTGYALDDNNDCVESFQEGGDPNCNEFRDGACVKCSFGFYFNNERICTKIPDDCRSFNIGEGKCELCYVGYALDENNRCVESFEESGDPNCNQFRDNACVKCSFGFYFNDDNICTKISDDCSDFNIDQKRCLRCYSGYQLNQQNQCVRSQLGVSDPNCNEFVDGVCTKCSFGFYFNSDNVCTFIPNDCLDFSVSEEKCLQCYTGYALNENNNCVESQDDTSDPHCNQFQNGICVKCSFGFYFNDARVCVMIPDECKTFNIEEQACEECYSGYSLNQDKQCQQSAEEITDQYCHKYENDKCVECSQGAYLTDQDFCKLVDPLCRTHDSSNGECTSCYPGFTLLVDGFCQISEVQDIDPNCKEFIDGQCVQCSFRFFKNSNGFCQTVDPLCKDYNEVNGHCLSCYAGFKIEGTICIEDAQVFDDPNCANWVDGTCTKCSVGAYFGSDGKCQLVDLLCRTYDQSNGDCLSCYPAFKIEGTKCVEDEGFLSQDPFCSQFQDGVCFKCSQGFYFGQDGLCMKVSDLCETYDESTGKCLTCYLGFKLDEEKGSCEEDLVILSDNNCAQFENGKCSKCSQGFYFNSQDFCEIANPLCKEFNPENGQCTECYIGFQLINGECLIFQQDQSRDPNCAEWLDENICLRCSQRAVFNSLGICEMVSVDCSTFNELTGQCTSCYPGFDLNDGDCTRSTQSSSCLQRDENGQCTKCSFRSYLDEEFNCVVVDDLCAEFDYDERECVGCYSGYSLLSGKCEITEVEEGKQIENCFAYTPEGNCLQCFERYYLSAFNVCTQVNIFCKGYDKGSGDCTSCYEGLGFTLTDGRCVQ